ncbi:ATP-binding protein [Sphingomonas sp. CLY1604]|uniref:ATP-binding protein n=1 Tax=Sphingomonas sp. CLY1604 TaxID=3457786 RepID=UPI003FD72056
MKGRIGLSRQLSVTMATLAFVAVVVSTAIFYIVYAVLERWRIVAPLPPGVADTTGLDVGIMLSACVLGIALAIAIAIRLARRIIGPLAAVDEAVRRVAKGDLTARVEAVPGAHGETALLIADFNAMADRLERMSDDVKVWNAQIAHELRTPLTILRGRLQGAKDGVFPLDDSLLVGLMKQVDGLTRLVEDLRSVSLADSGRLELRTEDVDLAAELNDMQPLLLALLTPAGFGLDLVLQAGSIRADMARIRQAVIALVDNARRYADPCTLRIEVRYTDGAAAIMVSDRGPGLPIGFEDDAFRQFARGTERSGGSGLGLAVVRGIARAHGGDVTYRRSRAGSLFCISLPGRSCARTN